MSASFDYDALGRRTSTTLSGAPVVNYIYDAAGHLTKVSRSIGGTTRNFNIAYDNAGRRTSMQVALYKSQGKWKYLKTAYGYDIANELTSMLLTNPVATIDSIGYTYDPNGNRTSMSKTPTIPLGGSMTGTDYDQANEMTALEGYGLAYDNNGNMTSRVDASGTTYYTWDARNRLTDISGPSLSASFDYDALGRRISRTVNSTTTSFIYDGWDIIRDTTGGVATDYTRTLNIDEPLAYYRANGTTRYYVADALGSITALTDANGIVTTSYKYDEFGKVTITGSDYNAFQYTGRENDGTGLYYYRARYYSPEMRRFVSEDPIGLWGGINFYSYVGNNPVDNLDPYGLFGWDNLFRYIFKKIAGQIGKNIGKNIAEREFDNSPEQQEMDKDTDGDGKNDFNDPDDDNDGIPDDRDPDPKNPDKGGKGKPREPEKCH